MKTKPPKDPLKAARKGSREAEIGMYDHPLPKHKVHRSKKQYDRQTAKARLKKGEPYFWIFITGTIHKKRVPLTLE
jgi:hypothetical protein